MTSYAVQRYQSAQEPGEKTRAKLRAAQWSCYFHRFYGFKHGGQPFGASFLRPVSFDDATLALHDSCDCPHARPPRELLRRCVSQMLLTGYRPSTGSREAFRELARQALNLPQAEKVDDQIESLIDWGRQEFDRRLLVRQFQSIEEELRDAGPNRKVISVPTEVIYRGDAFAVTKHVYFRRELDDAVTRLANPVNWTKLGQFFAETRRERPPGQRALPTDGDPVSWAGVLRERFVVNFNGFTTQTFDQRLRIDYTVTPDLARTDYQLMYDEDDQVQLNEGYFQVRKAAEARGWIQLTMQKTVRFTSSVLNMVAPAILTMHLESDAGGFRAFVDASADGAL